MSEQPATPVTHPLAANQDPTALTTQALQREVAQFRDLFDARLDGIMKALEARLDAMDKALALLQEYPTEVDRSVGQLKELHEERFKSVHVKFEGVTAVLAEREKQRLQWQESRQVAIEEAFNSLRDLLREQRLGSDNAVAKAESSMRDQLKAQELIASDLKERLIEVESRSKGAASLWGYIVGGIGLLGVIIAIFFTLAQMAPP